MLLRRLVFVISLVILVYADDDTTPAYEEDLPVGTGDFIHSVDTAVPFGKNRQGRMSLHAELPTSKAKREQEHREILAAKRRQILGHRLNEQLRSLRNPRPRGTIPKDIGEVLEMQESRHGIYVTVPEGVEVEIAVDEEDPEPLARSFIKTASNRNESKNTNDTGKEPKLIKQLLELKNLSVSGSTHDNEKNARGNYSSTNRNSSLAITNNQKSLEHDARRKNIVPMPDSLYNHFRPVESNIPIEDMSQFLYFGQKLHPETHNTTSSNSVEVRPTVPTVPSPRRRFSMKRMSVATSTISSTSPVPKLEEIINEEMNIAVEQQTVEKNKISKLKNSFRSHGSGLYFRKSPVRPSDPTIVSNIIPSKDVVGNASIATRNSEKSETEKNLFQAVNSSAHAFRDPMNNYEPGGATHAVDSIASTTDTTQIRKNVEPTHTVPSENSSKTIYNSPLGISSMENNVSTTEQKQTSRTIDRNRTEATRDMVAQYTEYLRARTILRNTNNSQTMNNNETVEETSSSSTVPSATLRIVVPDSRKDSKRMSKTNETSEPEKVPSSIPLTSAGSKPPDDPIKSNISSSIVKPIPPVAPGAQQHVYAYTITNVTRLLRNYTGPGLSKEDQLRVVSSAKSGQHQQRHQQRQQQQQQTSPKIRTSTSGSIEAGVRTGAELSAGAALVGDTTVALTATGNDETTLTDTETRVGGHSSRRKNKTSARGHGRLEGHVGTINFQEAERTLVKSASAVLNQRSFVPEENEHSGSNGKSMTVENNRVGIKSIFKGLMDTRNFTKDNFTGDKNEMRGLGATTILESEYAKGDVMGALDGVSETVIKGVGSSKVFDDEDGTDTKFTKIDRQDGLANFNDSETLNGDSGTGASLTIKTVNVTNERDDTMTVTVIMTTTEMEIDMETEMSTTDPPKEIVQTEMPSVFPVTPKMFTDANNNDEPPITEKPLEATTEIPKNNSDPSRPFGVAEELDPSEIQKRYRSSNGVRTETTNTILPDIQETTTVTITKELRKPMNGERSPEVRGRNLSDKTKDKDDVLPIMHLYNTTDIFNGNTSRSMNTNGSAIPHLVLPVDTGSDEKRSNQDKDGNLRITKEMQEQEETEVEKVKVEEEKEIITRGETTATDPTLDPSLTKRTNNSDSLSSDKTTEFPEVLSTARRERPEVNREVSQDSTHHSNNTRIANSTHGGQNGNRHRVRTNYYPNLQAYPSADMNRSYFEAGMITGSPRESVNISEVISKRHDGDTIATQDTVTVVSYILATLLVFPLALGFGLILRRLIIRKRKVLEESDTSSEISCRKDALNLENGDFKTTIEKTITKLPRIQHLCHEAEKPPPPPSQESRWEFPRDKLRLQTVLGQGNFGQVWKAEADDLTGHQGTTRLVAVKTVKEGASAREKEDLVRELEIMQQLGNHPNVVTLLGCCTDEEPHYLILEYVMYGKLLAYLRDHRTRQDFYNFSEDSAALTSRDLTVFGYCVARGMEYLSSKKIIHRDLAARNVLVDHNKLCKIADFGMSRFANEDGEVIEARHGRNALPIRWMAPESLIYSLFTTKTDVWSFGILMWEIVTLGSTPYPDMTAREVMRNVQNGYRLERPSHCRSELFRVISRCWQADPDRRPEFQTLRRDLAQLLEDNMNGHYVDLESFASECTD
ncbi:uncharacterized protein LOC107270943 isoform X2 [Cephus cinctus]|uniref:receptor protein-tyrosine kinase n=1 Tax=Cephus cinctus TaxID=211228 RepID=A0AAJ7C4X7_CEPCN|nr:uncharacterized protein LOC107270943 isoform X2 [Cephus cinctus]